MFYLTSKQEDGKQYKFNDSIALEKWTFYMHFKGHCDKIAVPTKQKCLWVQKDLEQGKEDCFEEK